jgi:hypothetical protein
MQRPDAMPQLKGNILYAWLAFTVSFIFGMRPMLAAGAAIALSIFRRVGYPKFNQEYLQLLLFEDSFMHLGFLVIAAQNPHLIIQFLS